MTQSNILFPKNQTDKQKLLRSVGWTILSVVVIYVIVFGIMPDCSRICVGPMPPECSAASLIGLLFMLIFFMSVIQIIAIVFRTVINMVKKNDR